MGVVPVAVAIRVHARPELVENSAATSSQTQPGVIFTINDSGNDPLLFALDTSGADRGVWRVTGAKNGDWEAASVGPCSGPSADSGATTARESECVYIGEVGDNMAQRSSAIIYRVGEPTAQRQGFVGTVPAQALTFRYADGPHDVESIYVAPNGDTFLIPKRRLVTATKQRRPALVFRLPAAAWRSNEPAMAALVDSLPIVPGSAPMRLITDAALSPDARYLAVRTYAQVYVFATDSATGRVRGAIPPAVCNVFEFDGGAGEGVAWFGRTGKLLLTSEGRARPMYAVACPMPTADTTPEKPIEDSGQRD